MAPRPQKPIAGLDAILILPDLELGVLLSDRSRGERERERGSTGEQRVVCLGREQSVDGALCQVSEACHVRIYPNFLLLDSPRVILGLSFPSSVCSSHK